MWIFRGRSFVKERVAKSVAINPARLCYESELLDYLKEKKSQGKILILATASHEIYANSIADHLGIFDQVIASDDQNNLKGKKKLGIIRKFVRDESFAYAGDSCADRSIWKEASSCIFVNAPSRDIKAAEAQGKAEKIIISNCSIGKAFLKEMRIYQWAKNILVFVPLLTSHSYQETTNLWAASSAFICFSLCASGVYFLNDLLDLESDRLHGRKCLRSLAACDLPLPIGILGAIFLPLAALLLSSLFLPLKFFGVLAFYFLITNVYSFVLKRVCTVDVMTLAVLYTLRVVAGSEAIDVGLSSWLMAFSVFVFVSLAYLKRYVELSTLSKKGESAHGRGYSAADGETMFTLGISNITASVLVLSLYISSKEVESLYRSPKILWLLCLLLLYWGNRIWVCARRGKIADDPLVFAIKDNVSRMVGLSFLVVVFASKYIQI
jgi:4-hydroxybenzoate polyprenyltransferase